MQRTRHPRLTVGLPVYNGDAFLATAIESILTQSFSDFQLIISDNGSTDRTSDICEEYAARDARVVFAPHLSNRGAAWNYNFVLEAATSEYFKWAAHDDICAPEFFSSCIRHLDQFPEAVLAYPRSITIDASGGQIGLHEDKLDLRSPSASSRFATFQKVYRRPYTCNPIFGVIRTSVLKLTPGIEAFVSSDMTLLGELALRGQLHELPERLFLRRDHPGTSVRAYPRTQSRTAWFDPNREGEFEALHWRWFRVYLSAIRRTALSRKERFLCYLQIGRWAQRHSFSLLKEAGRRVTWRPPNRRKPPAWPVATPRSNDLHRGKTPSIP